MNVPTQFGPYLLLERISVGGMAEVYKAKEYGVEGFERTVAVKRILPHVAEDDEFIAMFKDEAKIAVQLNHGNIAQIYNLGNEQDSFYIALEYINGRDLRAIFQKCQQQARPMPVAQACYVIMKICEGLDYAHNKKDKYNRELNIVHRDVSPPNILVSFEGEVKLIDFGVAKAAGRASRTQAGILKGKFGYMSPEQVRGMPLDRRSDVFSVGVVLFEVLTGNRLFQAETDFATLEKVRAVDVPRPSSLNPEIPKPLENIIYKALAREPEQRYQSAIELHDELQAFMFAQGLFYSRKDLAAWMRQQYAREIELEKEKAAAPTPPPVESGGRRKTMMMGPSAGATPPPPPPAGGRKGPPPPPGATPSPPPPPRGGTPAAPPRPPGATGPTPTVEAADEDGRPRKAVKRKTMVMTTARPNLPPPPGGGGPPKPRPRPAPAAVAAPGGAAPAPAVPPPQAARDGGDPPTVPMTPPKPRPNGAPRPNKATQSYAATAAAPSGDFDWDDEELETRLFGDNDPAAPPLPDGMPMPPRENDRPGQVGGELDAAIDIDLSEPPTLASPSVTVVPSAAPIGPMPGRTMAPMPVSAPTMPMGAAPQMVPPPTHNPFPQAPGQPMAFAPSTATMPMPAMQMPPPMQQQGMGPTGTQHMPQFAPPPTAMRPMPPQGFDDDMPRKSSAGLFVGIALGAVALIGAGFGGVYLYSKYRTSSSAAAGASTATAGTSPDAPVTTIAAARSGMTIQTTPSDAKLEVDGKVIDGTSPFVVSDLTAGAHTVKVSRDGFLPFERQVDLGAGGLSLPVSLQHRDVTLLLEVDPPGATMSLIVGGKAYVMGQSGAQYKILRDGAATYQIEAIAKGYLSERRDLEFTGEPSQKIKVALARDTAVAVVTPPPVADPGTPVADPGSGTPVPATPSKPPTARPKPPTSKPPKPRETPTAPTAAKTSTLVIGTNAGVVSAQVFVDGKLVGNTPVGGLKVTPGVHKVKWKWPDREYSESVQAVDGQTHRVRGG